MFDQHIAQEIHNIAINSNDLLRKILYQLVRIADNIDTDDCKIMVKGGDKRNTESEVNKADKYIDKID